MTKEERHKVYKEALIVAADQYPNKTGMCFWLREAADNLGIDSDPYNNLEFDFPEVFEAKPDKTFSQMFWFERGHYGYDARIRIIETAIKQTQP